MKALHGFVNNYPTISKTLFEQLPPRTEEYVKVAKSVFDTPFFDALAAFCKQEEGAEHFVRRVLGVSLTDAKALSRELRDE